MSEAKPETGLVSCRFCGRKLRLQEVRTHYAREHAEAWRRLREERAEERAEKTRREAEELQKMFRAKIEAVWALSVLENAIYLLPQEFRSRYLQCYRIVEKIVKTSLDIGEV